MIDPVRAHFPRLVSWLFSHYKQPHIPCHDYLQFIIKAAKWHWDNHSNKNKRLAFIHVGAHLADDAETELAMSSGQYITSHTVVFNATYKHVLAKIRAEAQDVLEADKREEFNEAMKIFDTWSSSATMLGNIVECAFSFLLCARKALAMFALSERCFYEFREYSLGAGEACVTLARARTW